MGRTRLPARNDIPWPKIELTGVEPKDLNGAISADLLFYILSEGKKVAEGLDFQDLNFPNDLLRLFGKIPEQESSGGNPAETLMEDSRVLGWAKCKRNDFLDGSTPAKSKNPVYVLGSFVITGNKVFLAEGTFFYVAGQNETEIPQGILRISPLCPEIIVPITEEIPFGKFLVQANKKFQTPDLTQEEKKDILHNLLAFFSASKILKNRKAVNSNKTNYAFKLKFKAPSGLADQFELLCMLGGCNHDINCHLSCSAELLSVVDQKDMDIKEMKRYFVHAKDVLQNMFPAKQHKVVVQKPRKTRSRKRVRLARTSRVEVESEQEDSEVDEDEDENEGEMHTLEAKVFFNASKVLDGSKNFPNIRAILCALHRQQNGDGKLDLSTPPPNKPQKKTTIELVLDKHPFNIIDDDELFNPNINPDLGLSVAKIVVEAIHKRNLFSDYSKQPEGEKWVFNEPFAWRNRGQEELMKVMSSINFLAGNIASEALLFSFQCIEKQADVMERASTILIDTKSEFITGFLRDKVLLLGGKAAQFESNPPFSIVYFFIQKVFEAMHSKNTQSGAWDRLFDNVYPYKLTFSEQFKKVPKLLTREKLIMEAEDPSQYLSMDEIKETLRITSSLTWQMSSSIITLNIEGTVFLVGTALNTLDSSKPLQGSLFCQIPRFTAWTQVVESDSAFERRDLGVVKDVDSDEDTTKYLIEKLIRPLNNRLEDLRAMYANMPQLLEKLKEFRVFHEEYTRLSRDIAYVFYYMLYPEARVFWGFLPGDVAQLIYSEKDSFLVKKKEGLTDDKNLDRFIELLGDCQSVKDRFSGFDTEARAALFISTQELWERTDYPRGTCQISRIAPLVHGEGKLSTNPSYIETNMQLAREEHILEGNELRVWNEIMRKSPGFVEPSA